MTALRPFARPVVLLWLCAFALFLAAPMEAFAKRDMVNGNDSLEGDPADGVDAIRSGGSGGTGSDPVLNTSPLPSPRGGHGGYSLFDLWIVPVPLIAGIQYFIVLPSGYEITGGGE